jgi:hypothetical protein
MQQANVPIRPQFPRWNVVFAPPGTKFLGRRSGVCSKSLRLCCGAGAACTRSRHQGLSGGCPMPQIFRPYADSAARATLVTLLLGPFAIAGLASWTMRSNYITTSLIRQSRSTSCRSVTPITSAFWPRLPLLPRRGRKVDGRRHSSDRHLHDVLLAARARGLPDESGPGERASASHRRRGACSGSHSCCADVCRLSARRPY